jgi:uncharacterized protein (DUF302 family)
MLFQIHTNNPIDVIGRKLEESAGRHQFGVLGVHDLKEKLAAKGHELGMDCRVFEVCNPGQAKKVLHANGAISVALPCRISVYGTSESGYTIATMLPTEMMKGFDEPAIAPVAQEVESVLKAMIEEAAA